MLYSCDNFTFKFRKADLINSWLMHGGLPVTAPVHVGSVDGTPLSQKGKGAVTQSSEQTKTPASTSWRTPTSRGCKVPQEIDRAAPLEPVADHTPEPALDRDGPPGKLAGTSTKTSDESNLFPDDDVNLSQARSSSGTPESRGGRKVVDVTVIPETIASTEGGFNGLLLQDTTTDSGVLGAAKVSDDDRVIDLENCNDAVVGSQVEGQGLKVAGTALGVNESSMAEEQDGQTPPEAAAAESPIGKVLKGENVGACGTRRQAALKNTMCPTPGVNVGAAANAGTLAGMKKVDVGRGRSTQIGARGEKQDNMKPLSHFGLQEKFAKLPVVAERGKGRGRGGKLAKRKRDAH